MATVCLVIFVLLTAAKLVTAIVLARRTRWWWAPSAAVLAFGVGVTASEPRNAGVAISLTGSGAFGISRWLRTLTVR